ncbi:hypothetical protein IV73_GL000452 [Weissella kandleri]|uniref:ATP synthase subunit c n=1 Tax=Weissella kandleri TaxID=1616 RepID=A0A0R2JD82_9LACO|nr:hypothetical protein IV73_GL000452 [Weissella kandleri]
MTGHIATIGSGIAVAGAAIGTGIGNGRVIAAMIEGTSRQPELEGKLRTNMFVGVALIEAVPILAFVISLMLLSK